MPTSHSRPSPAVSPLTLVQQKATSSQKIKHLMKKRRSGNKRGKKEEEKKKQVNLTWDERSPSQQNPRNRRKVGNRQKLDENAALA